LAGLKEHNSLSVLVLIVIVNHQLLTREVEDKRRAQAYSRALRRVSAA